MNMTLRTKGIRLAFIAAATALLIATPAAAGTYIPPAPGADGYVTPTDPTRTPYSDRATSTAEGIAAPENQDTFAYPQGECWVVPNRDNPEGTAIFVPYKHAAEWDSFKANTPFGQPRRCTSGWKTTAWSTCSASCDGTMTRTVSCLDEDGKVVPDSACAGAKPAETASCGGTCTPPPPAPVVLSPPPSGNQCSTGFMSPAAQNYPINNPTGPNYAVQVDPDARYQNKRWVGSNTTVHPNENVAAGLVPHCTSAQLAEINNPSNWPGGAPVSNFITADFSGGGTSASTAYSYEYNWQMWPVCSATTPTTCWSQGNETPNWTGDDSAKGVWDCAYGQPVYYPPAPIGGGGAWQETCYYGFGPNQTKFLAGMVAGGGNNAACSTISCLEPEQIYYSQALSGSSTTNPVINGR